jgi:hypothetical protein
MLGKDHPILDRIQEMRKLEESAGPWGEDVGWGAY